MSEALSHHRGVALARAGRLLRATVAADLVAAAAAIAAGVATNSIALVGFGLTCAIAAVADLAVNTRLRAEERGVREPGPMERRALRIVGATFLVLAAFLAFEGVDRLVRGDVANPSEVGIGVAAVAAVLFALLSGAVGRAAEALGSAALVAGARQMLTAGYLAVVLLVALVLGAALGFGWADPAGALATVAFLLVGAVRSFRAARAGRVGR